MSVFVLLCETRPLPVYPNVFWHPGLPWRKKQRRPISFNSYSCALVPVGVVNLATCVCIKSEEEGPGEKKHPLQYFEFGLQYLVQYCQSYIQHL